MTDSSMVSSSSGTGNVNNRRRNGDEETGNSSSNSNSNNNGKGVSSTSLSTGAISSSSNNWSHTKYDRRYLIHSCRRRVAKISIVHIVVLTLIAIFIGHRLYAHYEGHRIFVHSPIHTLERTCPKPSYPTWSDAMAADPKIKNPNICLTTLTDEQERSRLQEWVRFRNLDGLLQLTWKNKQDYVDKHGYQLFDESKYLDKSRPPAWSKILAVQRLLKEEQCEWVWWVDADTVIMNSERRVEDFLPAPDSTQSLILSPDHSGGYNSGGFLIRNTPWALKFVEDWWSMKNYIKPHGLSRSGDQDSFKAYLAALGSEFDKHAAVPPRCTFNSFAYFVTPRQLEKLFQDGTLKEQKWYRNEAYYHKGDLLAHVAGYNNKELPVQMLLDLAT